MLITPVRKSNLVTGVIGGLLFLMFESEETNIDYFFSAELFFNAWVIVLVFLLTIMITSLIPTIRFTSNNWHRPSNSISPLSIWHEPVNFIQYVAITVILSAVVGVSVTAVIGGSIVYPLHFFAIGIGIVCGLHTAPVIFKGNYAGKNSQP